jgi:hypothetical protein
MPAKDIFHDCVKNALRNDGWTITADPLRVPWRGKNLYIDLGAEKLVTAEKEGRKIAVEIKSFVGSSEVDDLEDACGQYLFYRAILKRTDPNREVFLAVSEEVFLTIFEDFGRPLVEDYPVSLVIFDESKEEILKWIP